MDNVTPISRDDKGRFPKGVSGNPAGMSAKAQAIKQFAQEKEATLSSIFEAKVPMVAKLLFAMMKDPKTSDDLRIKICFQILDRALGKPHQSVEKRNKALEREFDAQQIDPATRKAMIDRLNQMSETDDTE